jgi:hypothetical protein
LLKQLTEQAKAVNLLVEEFVLAKAKLRKNLTFNLRLNLSASEMFEEYIFGLIFKKKSPNNDR